MPSAENDAHAGRCSETGCTATYRDHRWGHSAAAACGWFFQRSGEAWCPEHNPPWVEAWRARQPRVIPPVDEDADA